MLSMNFKYLIFCFYIFLMAGITFTACKETPKKLPIIGEREIIGKDTIFHKIPQFSFLNQDSIEISNRDFDQNIYVTDFFFTSCPSICPKVKRQMLRIYDKFENDPVLKIVSHTMDPKRDTPTRLKTFAENLEVDTDRWIFLTGDKDSLLDMSENYFIAAYEDKEAPGGFDHSGKIVLVDKKRHVRAFAEGTDPDDVTDFLTDIQVLINEVNSN